MLTGNCKTLDCKSENQNSGAFHFVRNVSRNLNQYLIFSGMKCILPVFFMEKAVTKTMKILFFHMNEA